MHSLTVIFAVPPALFCKVASTLLRNELPQSEVAMGVWEMGVERMEEDVATEIQTKEATLSSWRGS